MGRKPAPPRCEPCGKKTLPTLTKAYSSALYDSARLGAAYRVYRCPHGNGWHLTTQRDRRRTA